MSSKSWFKNFLCQSSCKCLLGFNTFSILDAQAVQDSEPSEVENAIYSVILFPNEVVPRYVEDDEPLQLFELNDFFNFIDHIIAEVQLHQSLHVIESTKSLNLVVLKTQLGQTLQLVDIWNSLNAILSKV